MKNYLLYKWLFYVPCCLCFYFTDFLISFCINFFAAKFGGEVRDNQWMGATVYSNNERIMVTLF